jgi:hypothetical protein
MRCARCGDETGTTEYECLGLVICEPCYDEHGDAALAKILRERGYMDEHDMPTQKAYDNIGRIYDEEGNIRPGGWCDS